MKGHMMIADLYMKEEKYELADNEIDSMIGVINGDAESIEIVDRNRLEKTINQLGYIYLDEKEYKKAIELFKRNVQLFSESYNAHDSIAEAYLTMGDRENAIKYYKMAVELNPGDSDYAKRILKNSKDKLKELEK